MSRRIRISLEGVKSITLDIIESDEAGSDASGLDADIELANGDPVGFGFTPFSTSPDEE